MANVKLLIEVDSKGAVKSIQDFSGAATQAGKSTTDLKGFAGKLQKELGGLQAQAVGATGKIGGLAAALGPAGIAAAALAGGALLAGKALLDLTSAAAAYGGRVGDMAERTGMSVEGLQRLEFAARQSGTSIEAVSGAVTVMQRAMVDTPQKFAALGLSVSELMAMNPAAAFEEVAGAIRQLPAGAQQTAAAMSLMGRSAAEIMPMLKSDISALGDQAEQLGITMSSQTVAAMDEFGDAADAAKAAAEGLGRNLGAILIQSGDAATAFQAWAEGVGVISRAVKEHGPDIYDFIERVFNFGGKTRRDLASEKMAGFGKVGEMLSPTALLFGTRGYEETDRGAREIGALFSAIAGDAAKAFEGNKPPPWFGTSEQRSKAADQAAKELIAHQQRIAQIMKSAMPKPLAPKPGAGIEPVTGLLGGRTWETAVGGAATAAIQTKIQEGNELLGEQAGFSFKESFGESLKDLPSIILGAFQGGGDVGAAIGASLGGAIGKGLAPSLAKELNLGKTLSGVLGSAMPIVGSLVGGLVGQGIGAIGGLFGFGESKAEKEAKAAAASMKDLVATLGGAKAQVEGIVGAIRAAGAAGGLKTALGVDALKGGMAALKGWSGELQQLRETALSKGAEGLGAAFEYLASKEDIAAERLQSLGLIGWGVFQALREQGYTMAQALEKLGPAFEAMRGRGAGVGGEFGGLIAYADMVAANEALVSAVEGTGYAYEALGATGSWSLERIRAGEAEATAQIHDLEAAGFSTNQALSLSARQLLALEDASKRYGVSLDASTQALIDQARTSGAFEGIVDPMSQMLEIQNMMLLTTAALAEAFGSTLPPQVRKYIDELNRIPAIPGIPGLPAGAGAGAGGEAGGEFGGGAGYPDLIPSQAGFSGIVRRPTVFLAGEAGAESVSVRPLRGGGAPGASISINVGGITVSGASGDTHAIGLEVARLLVARAIPELEKAVQKVGARA